MCCRSVLKDTFGYNDQSSKTTVIQIFVQEITRKEILKLTPDMTKTINYNLNYLSSAAIFYDGIKFTNITVQIKMKVNCFLLRKYTTNI